MNFYCPSLTFRLCSTTVLAAWLTLSAQAQRQMEKLGRGVVALHSATSQAYVGWRLLATDPTEVGFNLYRSANGGAGVKLNPLPLTNTTDFLDTTANLTVSNAWYVVPVISGVEQTPSAAAGLTANSPVRQYISWPLRAVTNGAAPPYDVKFCWVGDFDGDGEYDYLVDRLSTTTATNQFLQAYKRDGTLLWQMDMGSNSVNQYNIEPGSSAISVGDKDNVTVYDLDGDGRAEVCVRTARGVILPDGTTVTGPDDTTQYLSILDGLTGHELARTTITNLWPGDGPLNSRFGIMYCDGVHPSLLIEGENRNASLAFQREAMTHDYRNGQLTRRWFHTPAAGANESWGHQIRIMDVNHDGIDDLIEVGSAKNGANGQPLFDTELMHGDRFHVTDIDPDRPGLEMFSIQQNNPTLLATALIDAGSGSLIKKWYASGVVDVGRGTALDLDPNHRGVELYSTQPGIFDCKGNQIYANSIWPPEAIWWDADLSRELEDGAGNGALSPVINKFDPNTGGAGRIYSIYDEGVHQAYGGRAAFWGDILGDWREELVLVANDYSELRVYTTKLTATNRLYCLMQNPAYRDQATCKGYYQASYVDYYLGLDMPPPAPAPISDARLVWRGDGTNVWDTATTLNWRTNWFYAGNANTNPAPFNPGDTVLFDLTGSNNTAITLTGSLTPGNVRVHSPKNFTLNGSGALTGTMALTKAGAGKLTFAGTNTYYGKTLIAEGPFVVNGSLPNSAVTVRGGVWLDGRLGGTGSLGAAVIFQEGAGVSPGAGTNSPGTLSVSNSVTFAGRTISDFDLSDNPSGTTNDQFIATGNLILQGTNTLYIRRLNATLLSGGVYPLINYSGTLTGSLSNLVVAGLAGIPVALTNPPGQIALVVKSFRAPATITWTGGQSANAWDLLTSSNWLNGAAKDQFAPFDTARFDNIGTSNLTVTLIGDLNCSNVIVDSTENYTLTGNGGIVGTAGLTKTNSGTLTIGAANSTFTGKTTIAGGTMVVSELDAIGFPSPLGNPPGGSTNLMLAGSSTLRITGESYTDRGLTLNSGTNTIEVVNAADQVTIADKIIGSGALLKSGPGGLALTVSNGYSGGTFVFGGSISLGSVAGNQYGLGSGPVTISNATVNLINLQANENCAWNIRVPANATATINCDGRSTMSGSLTGAGTLNAYSPYVRTDFSGNWSSFTGQINATGGNFRVGNANGYPLARLNVGSAASLQNRISGTPTIPVGELSGDDGATISASGSNDGLSVLWRVGGRHTTATFAGTIKDSIGLIKEGTGAWNLTGANTYSSGTTVNGGTLLVNNAAGSGTGTGTVTVNSGGALGGGGAIAGLVTISNGGKLTPTGTLTLSNNLVLNSTSISRFDLGAINDLVVVNGNLTLAGKLDVTNSGDFFSSTNVIFTYSGTLGGAGLTLGTVLPYFNYTINTSTPGQVKLIAVSTVPLPPAPTNLVATASNAIVFLNWSATSNTLSYHVKRSLVSGGPYTDIAVGVAGTAFTDTAVANNNAYYYVISASNGTGVGTNSAEAGAAPPGIVPDTPTGLTAVAGNQMVALTWNAATAAVSYNVKGSTNNGGPYTNLATGITDTSWYDTGLTAGRTYYYVVSGVNLNGESTNSAQASATPFQIPAAYWTNRITSAAQSWNANSNWTNVAAFPNGVSAVAVMKADITATQTNNLNQDITLGVFTLGDANNTSSYILAGNGGTLIFDNNGIAAMLTQASTSKGDTIATPIVISDSLAISNLSANPLTLAGVVAGTNSGLVINSGNVTLTAANTYDGGSTVNGGTLQITGSGNVGTGNVTLNGGTYYMNNTYPANTIHVPTTGTLQTYGLIYPGSTLTGSGQLYLNIGGGGSFSPGGNWTAFGGTVTFLGNNWLRAMNGNNCSGNAIWDLGAGTAGINNKNGGYSMQLGALFGGSGTGLSGATTATAYLTTYVIGGRNTNCTFYGRITDGGAAATALTKVGSGTLTLAGTNTYTGNTLINGGNLQIGAGGASGALVASSISNNATLAFNRSDAVSHGGSISGPGDLLKLGAGSLTLTGANTYSGLTRVAAGKLVLTDAGLMASTSGYKLTNGALLDASTLTSALVLGNGQTLSGSGSVLGNVNVGDGATLSPGDSVGTLIFSNSLGLSALGTTIMEISKSPFTNDQIVAQSLAFGGTLLVNSLGVVPFAAGDSFKLFSVSSATGAFANIQIPPPGPDLAWYTNALLTTGTITVVGTGPPAIASIAPQAGGSFRLTFTGQPGAGYEIRSTTNLALTPIQNWSLLGSGTFGLSPVVFDDLNATNFPLRFYVISVP